MVPSSDLRNTTGCYTAASASHTGAVRGPGWSGSRYEPRPERHRGTSSTLKVIFTWIIPRVNVQKFVYLHPVNVPAKLHQAVELV